GADGNRNIALTGRSPRIPLASGLVKNPPNFNAEDSPLTPPRLSMNADITGRQPRAKPAVSTRSKLRSHSITLSARASIALRFAGGGLTNLSQRLLVGINDAAGLLLGGREHCLIAHAAPGLQVRSFGDAVILDL